MVREAEALLAPDVARKTGIVRVVRRRMSGATPA